jgi:hypothetical protein
LIIFLVCVVCVSSQVFSNLSRWRGVRTSEHRHRQVCGRPWRRWASRRGSWLDAASPSSSPFPHPSTPPPFTCLPVLVIFSLEMKRTYVIAYMRNRQAHHPRAYFRIKTWHKHGLMTPSTSTIRFLVQGKKPGRPDPPIGQFPQPQPAGAAPRGHAVSVTRFTAAPALASDPKQSKARVRRSGSHRGKYTVRVGCERQALY